MKKLIINKQFKDWVRSFEPDKKWDFENIEDVENELVNIIRKSGYLNLTRILIVFNRAYPK